jgi:hypothetical protein
VARRFQIPSPAVAGSAAKLVKSVMPEDALYELEPIVDNPKFEGFAFEREGSIRGKTIGGESCIDWDFGSDDIMTKGRAWTVRPLAPVWTPQRVLGRVRSFNDYPCVNLIVPAFSGRAVAALRDFLEPNGELLPLVSSVGEYYAYNINKVADILDHKKSKIKWADKKHVTSLSIRRYECLPRKMNGLSIFRIVELPSSAFVTQRFVDRVAEHGLEGFHFIRLWPMPKGADWHDEDRKARKLEQAITTRVGAAPVKGNTLVLVFPTAGRRPSRVEKNRLKAILDDIDAQLYDPKSDKDAAYFGSLEGNDQVPGELRVFLSCPDVEVLFRRLRKWLRKLEWDAPIRALKRYGEFVDASCREDRVDV